MNRGKIHTLLVLCMSMTVVFGGWFFTEGMLDRKESELFTQNGKILTSTAEIKEEFEGLCLSEDKIAEILLAWKNGGREVPHEPLEGQMNMKQAINAGRDWIAMLVKNNILPVYMETGSFDKINAVLYNVDTNKLVEELLVSYWKITYLKEDVKITLTIHAASGQVWSADILMDEKNMLYGTCTEQELLAIAFPFVSNEKKEIEVENQIFYKILEKGNVYAVIKRDGIVVDKEEPIARLSLMLCTDIENL